MFCSISDNSAIISMQYTHYSGFIKLPSTGDMLIRVLCENMFFKIFDIEATSTVIK